MQEGQQNWREKQIICEPTTMSSTGAIMILHNHNYQMGEVWWRFKSKAAFSFFHYAGKAVDKNNALR